MTALVLAALIVKVIDFAKLVVNAQVKPAITQAASWVAGVVLVVLASHSDATAAIVLPSTSAALGDLDGAGQILVGMVVASFGSLLVDAKQAIDNTDSASKPPLVLGGPVGP